MNDLHETARSLVAAGKGLLAADESSGTIKKRFDAIGVESTGTESVTSYPHSAVRVSAEKRLRAGGGAGLRPAGAEPRAAMARRGKGGNTWENRRFPP
jgi:hypothetical protein